MEFDDLMTNHLGPFGKYQAICAFAFAMHAFPYFVAVKELIYQGVHPIHYCNDSFPNQLLRTKWNLTDEQIFQLTAPQNEFKVSLS